MKIKRNSLIENKGITLVALSITVLVLIIIASVTVYSGKEAIQKAKKEEIRTNMLLIQAKAKEYVEECDFLKGPPLKEDATEEQKAEYAKREEDAREKAYASKGLTNEDKLSMKDPEIGECYKVGEDTLKIMGLGKIDPADGYLIKFDEENLSVEIYISSEEDEGVAEYSLTDLNAME